MSIAVTGLVKRLSYLSPGPYIKSWIGQRRVRGVLLVLLSAASFGAVSPFVRLAYDSGVNVTTVMVVRYALAVVAVLGYLIWRRQSWKLSGRRLGFTVILSLFLGGLSFAYLGSIRYIPVSLAALIYYTYPILATLLGHVSGVEKLEEKDHLAYLITFGGQGLSLSGLALLLGISWATLHVTGLLMAGLAAFSFALVIVFGSRLMRVVPPMVLNLHVALVNAALFTAIAVLGSGFTWPAATWGWIGLMGAGFFFILGFLGLFTGLKIVGPSRGACLTNIEPIITIALAITLLREPFGPWQVVGAVAVLSGVYIMCRRLLRGSALQEISVQEMRKIKEVVRLVYCSPECRQGTRCLLVD